MRLLIILHAMGVFTGSIAAAVEIESILISGPGLSLFSLYLIIFAYRRNRTLCLYYALGATTVSVACFCVIFGLQWGPGRAHAPIGVSVFVFGLCNCIFCVFALKELKRPVIVSPKSPFQYSIAAIMGLTLVVAVSFSLVKTLGDPGIALAALLCYLSLVSYLLLRFHRRKKRSTEIRTSLPAPDPRTFAGGG
jgi:hypothetical protein